MNKIKNVLAVVGALAILAGSVAAFGEMRPSDTRRYGKSYGINRNYPSGTKVCFRLTGFPEECRTVPAGYSMNLGLAIGFSYDPE